MPCVQPTRSTFYHVVVCSCFSFFIHFAFRPLYTSASELSQVKNECYRTAPVPPGSHLLTIVQNSASTALNWQSFSIGAGETVLFVQPGANAVALNRVIGPDPSTLLGNLSSNGQVFLVNPNGILFGQGASVNVGGLVASTLNITDSDFMAGRYTFSGSSTQAVRNTTERGLPARTASSPASFEAP